MPTKLLLLRGNDYLCSPCASKAPPPTTGLTTVTAPPDLAFRKAITARLACIENELPTLQDKFDKIQDRIICLRLERTSLNGQLNGTHGEATNEDDVVSPKDPNVASQLNGNNGEATNSDDVYFSSWMVSSYNIARDLKAIAQSAVVSSFGKHEFIRDNAVNTSRREEIVHAPPEVIRKTMKLKPRTVSNTKKLRASAEKRHQKEQSKARDVERCEREFSKLLQAMSPDSNQPQIGFTMGEFLSKIGALPGAFVKACQDLTTAIEKTSKGVDFISSVAQTAVPWISTLIKTAVIVVVVGVLIYSYQTDRRIMAGICIGLLTAFLATSVADGASYLKAFIDKVSAKFFPDGPVTGAKPPSDPKPVPPLDEPRTFVDVPPSVGFTFGTSWGAPTPPIEPIEPPNHAQVHTAFPEIDQTTLSKIFVSAFSCGFLAFGDRKKGTFDQLKDFVVHFPSATKGIDAIVDFSSKIMLSMLNHVREFLGMKVYDSLFDSQNPFLDWIVRCEEFINAFHDRSIPPSSSSYGQINDLINQGHKHTQFLRTVTDDPGARSRMGVLMEKLAKCRDTCIAVNPNIVASRPKPVCVYLYGKGGVGKSELAKMLARWWLSRTLSPKEIEMAKTHEEAYVYYRTPETEYWDGYLGQKVTIFDDFGQAEEVRGGDSAHLDIIRCLNGVPALLHMAALNDKGSTYFTSPLVILSSNVDVPRSEAIADIKAVIRRPDFYVRVDLQPELKIDENFLGDSSRDYEIMAMIKTSQDPLVKSCVYDLTLYKVHAQSLHPHDISPISPLGLLDRILEKGAANSAAFEDKVPPGAEKRADRASELQRIFVERQLAVDKASKKPIPAPAPKPAQDINVFQGIVEFKDRFIAGAKATPPVTDPNACFEDFWRIFKIYLSVREQEGVKAINTLNSQAKVLELLEVVGLDWDDVLKNFHRELIVADRRYRLANALNPERVAILNTPPTGSYADHDVHPSAAVKESKSWFDWSDWEPVFSPVKSQAALNVAGTPFSFKAYFADLFSAIGNTVRRIAGDMFELFGKYWYIVLAVCTAFTLSIVLWRWVTLGSTTENKAESIPSRIRSKITVKKSLAMLRARQKPGAPPNAFQATADLQRAGKKVLKHTYHTFWEQNSTEAFGHVTMLTDRVGLVNIHTCDIVVAGAEIRKIDRVYLMAFGCLSHRYAVPISAFAKVHRGEHAIDLDLGLIAFPNCNLPPASDLIDNIPSISDWEGRSQLSIITPHVIATDESIAWYVDTAAIIGGTTGPYEGPDGTEFTNAYNINYNCPTRSGQCGLPVLSDSITGKYFVGLHKCGNTRSGCGAPLVREWVDDELELLQATYPDYRILKFKDARELKEAPNNFSQCYPAPVAGVTKPFHGSDETKLQPLPHAYLFEQSTAPAVLDTTKIDGKWVNPYILNREKVPEILQTYPEVRDAKRIISTVLLGDSRPANADLKFWCRVLTFEEALYGIPGTALSGVDLSTSAGYPWCIQGGTSKKPWVTDPDKFALLRKTVEIKIGLMKRGYRPDFMVMDVMKDERRTLEKVSTASSRVVSPTPFDELIIDRMYFGGFAMWIQLNKVDNGITIGMNPYGDDFNYMCTKLFRENYSVFCGDSKAFDLCQHQEPLRHIFSAINDFYGDDPESNLVRDILSLSFFNARHICFPVSVSPTVARELAALPVTPDPFTVEHHLKILNASNHREELYVYDLSTGDPSGHFLTACVNSCYSKTKPYLVLQWRMSDTAYVISVFQDGLLVVMVLGDDFIISVHKSLHHQLNAMTFAAFSALYGMTITRENKEPITVPFPPDPPVFLKRLCRYERRIGRWVGSLQMTSIVEAFCWVRKTNPTTREIKGQFEGAILELSLWGPEIYDQWYPRISEAYRVTFRAPMPRIAWHEAVAQVSTLHADFRP